MSGNLAYMAFAASMLGTAAIAEGRDDPFMRCTFDNGRVVVFAENGDDFEWREGDFIGTLVQPTQTAQDPVLTFFGPWADPERIDVFVGWSADGNPEMEIGSAMLSRTIVSDAGKMISQATPGLCEDYTG